MMVVQQKTSLATTPESGGPAAECRYTRNVNVRSVGDQCRAFKAQAHRLTILPAARSTKDLVSHT